MSIRVYIGTTEGPAEIQRLTEEPPEIRSVVCLDGRAVALPISRDYESFVRRPTGVVERLWGGAAFRMDVGARITDGLSWQLPAFLAHALHAAGALAAHGAEADAAVWASGEVDAALDIRAVDAIARKLELSADLLRALAASRPWVIVPTDAVEVARATLTDLGLTGCRVVGVDTAAKALSILGLAMPGASAAPVAPSPRRMSRRRVVAAMSALSLLAAVGAAGWTVWDWRRAAMQWTEQAQSGDLIALDQTLSAVAATPACLTCSAQVARFRSWLSDQALPITVHAEATRRAAYGGCPPAATAPVLDPVALTEGPGLVGAGACRVRYVVAAPQAALFLSSPGGVDSVATGAGEAAVTLELPPLAIYGSDQRVVALASRLPLGKIVPWLRPLLPPAPAALPDALTQRLAMMGVGSRVLRHRIEPERGW